MFPNVGLIIWSAHLTGCDWSVLGPVDVLVYVPVPHVVDGAAGATHDEGAGAEYEEKGGVGEGARGGGQAQAPPTRPE